MASFVQFLLKYFVRRLIARQCTYPAFPVRALQEFSGEWHESIKLVTHLPKRQFGFQRWSKITSP